jgi:hypothetical protein
MSSAPDNNYLDLEIVNNDKQGSQIKTNLQFNENRTNPVLDNPSNYEMSVVRFEIDTPAVSLPIFIPLVDVDGTNGDLNQTAYTVSMAQIAGSSLTNLKTANVVWSPEDKTATLPKNSTLPSEVGPVIQTFPLSEFITSVPDDNPINTWVLNNQEFIDGKSVGFVVDYTNPFWSSLQPNNLTGYYITYTGTDLAIQPLKILTNSQALDTGLPYYKVFFTLEEPLYTPSIPPPLYGFVNYTFAGIFQLNSTVPIPYITSQDITTGYYNCYNVKWWLSCVNATLDNVWTQVSGATTSNNSPSLVVDDGTNLITLLTPFSQGTNPINFAVSEDKATGSGLPIYLSTNSNPPVQYVLFFNELLFNLFSGLPSVYYGNTLAPKSIFVNLADNEIVRIQPNLLAYFIQPINYSNFNIIQTPPVSPVSAPPVNLPFPVSVFGDVTLSYNRFYSLEDGSLRIEMVVNNANPFWSNLNVGDLVGWNITYSGDDLTSQPLIIMFNTSVSYNGTAFVVSLVTSPNLTPVGIPNPTTGQAYTFTGIFTLNSPPPPPPPPSYWVTTTSEYSPVPLWCPIMSLQISSTLIPRLLSYTTASIPYNSLNASGFVSSGNNSEISDMITDIEVGLTTGSEYKPSVLYIPRGEYRFIELHGSQPLYNIDFRISWKTQYGQVVAFRLGSQCGANLKILFRRKRFDLLNLPPYDTN